MRKLLFAAVLLLASCSKTPQERAQSLVEDYLEQTANDPSSVQDVEVGELFSIADTYPNDSGLHAVVYYRAKNAYGALVKESVSVRFNKEVTEITHFGDAGWTQHDIDSLLYSPGTDDIDDLIKDIEKDLSE